MNVGWSCIEATLHELLLKIILETCTYIEETKTALPEGSQPPVGTPFCSPTLLQQNSTVDVIVGDGKERKQTDCS